MTQVLVRHRAAWPLAALLISAAMLATAHAFERFADLAPCALCLRQREVYWGAIVLSVCAVAAARWRPAPASAATRAFEALLGIAFLTGAVLAFYHVGVEHKWWLGPRECAAGPVNLDAFDPAALGGAMTVVRCDVVAWSFLGLSMAAWNVVVSLMLAGLSFALALRGDTGAPVMEPRDA
jgi:disulfide bond formation protein DsbB